MVKSTVPDGANGQPIGHEKSATLRGLTSHEQSWFGDMITLINKVVLHSGHILVHPLHRIFPDVEGHWHLGLTQFCPFVVSSSLSGFRAPQVDVIRMI